MSMYRSGLETGCQPTVDSFYISILIRQHQTKNSSQSVNLYPRPHGDLHTTLLNSLYSSQLLFSQYFCQGPHLYIRSDSQFQNRRVFSSVSKSCDAHHGTLLRSKWSFKRAAFLAKSSVGCKSKMQCDMDVERNASLLSWVGCVGCGGFRVGCVWPLNG